LKDLIPGDVTGAAEPGGGKLHADNAMSGHRNAGRCIIQHFAKLLFTENPFDSFHIVPTTQSHDLRKEPLGRVQRCFGGFPPEELSRDLLQVARSSEAVVAMETIPERTLIFSPPGNEIIPQA
jgi:hypothetical protein